MNGIVARRCDQKGYKEGASRLQNGEVQQWGEGEEENCIFYADYTEEPTYYMFFKFKIIYTPTFYVGSRYNRHRKSFTLLQIYHHVYILCRF